MQYSAKLFWLSANCKQKDKYEFPRDYSICTKKRNETPTLFDAQFRV